MTTSIKNAPTTLQLTKRQVAKIFRTTHTTVNRWIRDERIEAIDGISQQEAVKVDFDQPIFHFQTIANIMKKSTNMETDQVVKRLIISCEFDLQFGWGKEALIQVADAISELIEESDGEPCAISIETRIKKPASDTDTDTEPEGFELDLELDLEETSKQIAELEAELGLDPAPAEFATDNKGKSKVESTSHQSTCPGCYPAVGLRSKEIRDDLMNGADEFMEFL